MNPHVTILGAGLSGALLIAADGAGSVVRRAMTAQLGARVNEDMLEHGYKELTLPPGPDGTHAIEKHALHIWPRGGFMLIALPNLDGSFTVTLFLELKGPDSFSMLDSRESVAAFFRKHFPDVAPLMPGLALEFLEHPVGRMGTVHADRWSAPGGTAVLLGDAAHAIVPFHGQGMNACFEDCFELNRLLETTRDWARACDEFERVRSPDTDAIAAMALENYVELRDTVRDPKFVLRKELSFERGKVQARILEDLTATAESLAQLNPADAGAAVMSRLRPVSARGADTGQALES